MINPEDLTIIDSRESYTVEEAVAKMLGWMHGPERLKNIQVDIHGILPSQLPHLYSLPSPLFVILDELKERARVELLDAADAFGVAKSEEKDVLCKIVGEKEDAVLQSVALIDKAYFYGSEIKNELENTQSSILKKDQAKTDETGITHVTLYSLNAWAKQFGITIIDAPEGLVVSTQKQYEQTIAAPTATYIAPKRADALGLILEDLLRANPELKPARAMKELSALIGTKNCAILSVFDEGVKWRRDDGSENDIEITSKDSVGERLRYWKRVQSKSNPRLT